MRDIGASKENGPLAGKFWGCRLGKWGASESCGGQKHPLQEWRWKEERPSTDKQGHYQDGRNVIPEKREKI